MAKGKKQFKVVSSMPEIDQAELLDMIQQLSGDPTKLDPEIVKDKHQRLVNNILRFVQFLESFKKTILLKLRTKVGNDGFFDNELKRLDQFADSVKLYLSDEVNDENRIYMYQALKESSIIDDLLKVCKKLKEYDAHIKNHTQMDESFIKQSPGEEIVLFDFCRINIKHLFTHILEENIPDKNELKHAKMYILTMMNMMYLTTKDIYNIITTPDVDINKLSELIIAAIGAAKKHIPNCNKAFKMIEDSIDMLKHGMGEYYRSFVATGNPATIFENFVNDIAQDVDMDRATLIQFKKIIFHFRKKADSMPKKNPMLEKVFGQIDKVMGILETE